MADVIKVSRGNTFITAGQAVTTVDLTALGITIANLAKADCRLTGATPFAATTTIGGIPPLNNDTYSMYATLTSTTVLTLTGIAGGGPFRQVSWEIWEYVGPANGPNEIIFLKQTADDFTNIAAGSIGVTAGVPWAAQLGTNADNNDVLSFNRGIFWTAGGAASTPGGGNVTYHNDVAFGLPFQRFNRGDINGSIDCHYAPIWFKGSNWNVQRILQPTPTPGTTLTVVLGSSVLDWKKAFIYAQRRSNGPLGATQGFVTWPGTAADANDPTRLRISYPAGGSGNAFNLAVLMIVSNQTLRDTVHENSVTGGGTDFTGASAVNNESIALAATAFTNGALFVNADNSDVINSASAQAWIAELRNPSLGVHDVEWRRGEPTATVSRWNQSVTDFTFPDVGLPDVEAIVVRADGNQNVAQALGNLPVARAGAQLTVAQAAALNSVARAAAAMDVARVSATMPVAVISGTVDVGGSGVALFDLCPVADDICVSLLNTRTFGWTLQDSLGAAIDISGGSFFFTVNRQEDPTSTTDEIVKIAGVIPVGTDGVFQFTPTLVDPTRFNEVGDFFYDVEFTDATGEIYTVLKGKCQIKQTITDPATL